MVSDNIILWPREQSRQSNVASANLFADEQKIRVVSGLPEFKVPDNPTWTEDPFDSRSWSLYYQSLGWLYAAEAAYKLGKFDAFPTYAKDIFIDFFEANSDIENPTNSMTWRDGTNAFRLANASYFYENYFKPDNQNNTGIVFSAHEQEVFSNGLDNMVQVDLYELGRGEYWANSNHRFFHAMALATHASVFGNADGTPFYQPNADAYLAQAFDVIDEILVNIVDPATGVTREQSLMYQRVDISLVQEVKKYILDQGYTLEHDYNAILEKMIEFDFVSRRPGDKISEIGDSFFGSDPSPGIIQDSIDEGLISPVTQYILTRGEEGTRPADLIDYSSTGYVILRPEYEWENPRDLRVIMDVTEKVVSHGHYDNLNVLMSAYGKFILVDSGGPYSYDQTSELGLPGPFRNEYLMTSAAHNVVMVDGESYDADTHILNITDTSKFSLISAHHGGYENIDIARDTLVLKEKGIVLLLDDAVNTGAANHEYSLNLHFAPEATGVDGRENTEFNIDNVDVDVAVNTSGIATYNAVSGRLGANPQGWVSPGAEQAVPAPVLEIQQTANDAWFSSAVATSLNASSKLFFETEKTANGYQIWVSFEGVRWNITLDNHQVTSLAETPAPAGATDRIGNHLNNILTASNVGEWLGGRAGHDTLTGGTGNDLLVGGVGLDSLTGGDGNDTLLGGDNTDNASGGEGADYIKGGSGNDGLAGDAGNDTVYGGNGHDTINGGDQNDVLSGELHNDSITGGAGIDSLYGGLGHDTLNGGDNSDRMDGGENNDAVIGGAGNDTIYGGSGNDTLSGGNGLDFMNAGDGEDILYGESHSDTLLGGAGNDTLSGGIGADALTGNTGTDIFLYASVSESTVTSRDTITDFNQSQNDSISLQSFVGTLDFIGTAAFSAANQVRYQSAGGITTVLVSTDTDTSPEMAIDLTGIHTLTAADFSL